MFKSADPDYFISHVDVTRIAEYRARGGEADRRSVDRAPVPPPQREPPRHHRADRGPRARRRQRVRAGVRHALRRARVGDLRPVGAGVRRAPRRRRHPASRAPHGPRPGARGHAERARTTTRSWPNATAGSTARCPPKTLDDFVSSLAHRIAALPAAGPPRSRTASMRSRLHRPRTSAAIRISSSRRRARARDATPDRAAIKRGFQTRDAEMDLDRMVAELAER